MINDIIKEIAKNLRNIMIWGFLTAIAIGGVSYFVNVFEYSLFKLLFFISLFVLFKDSRNFLNRLFPLISIKI